MQEIGLEKCQKMMKIKLKKSIILALLTFFGLLNHLEFDAEGCYLFYLFPPHISHLLLILPS